MVICLSYARTLQHGDTSYSRTQQCNMPGYVYGDIPELLCHPVHEPYDVM